MSWNLGDVIKHFVTLKTTLVLYHVEHRSKPKESPDKITLTLEETQQLPVFEEDDSKDEIFVYNGQITIVEEEYASTFKLMQTR